ncbi:MAG: sugar phosphate isomerase/epimerase [Armatimonadetes bacterium]|nr:sugar phosphate isomerase/epimerase [Armatimonadota bacterium]
MKKGICIGCLPRDASLAEKLRLAKRAGYDGVEINTLASAAEREEYAALAREIGIELPSVMASGHWQYPLSSDNEETRQAGLANIRASVDTAAAVGAATVLVVPGVVNDTQPYASAYEIALRSVRELAPYAAARRIRLGVENVWNRFLLSSREMGQFLAEVNSPAVGLYFDCGNIMAYGYPQLWLRELRQWLLKVHVKDFDTNTRQFRHLLQGNVPWKEVHAALVEADYHDYLTVELPPYPAYGDQMVFDSARQLDRIIAGE